MRILLIEDDRPLGAAARTGLIEAGFTVDWLTDGEAGLAALAVGGFDAVVLDIGLPKRSGLELLRLRRQAGDETPVLLLTAHDGLDDRVQGLDSGADDYLVKPFALAELAARLRALTRRARGRAEPMLHWRALTLDPASREVAWGGRPVRLTPAEYKLLHLLLAASGRVLTRESLTDALYGWDEGADSNTLEVHVHHLRRKIESAVVETVRGVGYRLGAP